MNTTIKLLLLILGLYLVIAGHLALALFCFVIVIGLEFIATLMFFFIGIVVILMLSGCSSFVKTENIYIDNSAVNNYVGNPCSFYLGDRCLMFKDGRLARNPDNPLKGK